MALRCNTHCQRAAAAAAVPAGHTAHLHFSLGLQPLAIHATRSSFVRGAAPSSSTSRGVAWGGCRGRRCLLCLLCLLLLLLARGWLEQTVVVLVLTETGSSLVLVRWLLRCLHSAAGEPLGPQLVDCLHRCMRSSMLVGVVK